MIAEWAATDFLTAFRTRRECCRALLALSTEQQALIAADDYSGLLALLAHKQQVLDALLNDRGEPGELRRAWQSARDRFPARMRQECEQTLAETEDLLRQLLASEQAAADLLTARRDATEQALAAVHRGGEAQAAYDAPLSGDLSRRLDVDL
jgi:hypothetical protein